MDGSAGGRPPPRCRCCSSASTRCARIGSAATATRAASTPVLDRLAARGLRFAQAATVAPLTLPAHASLLSGTFPAFHGVRDNGSFYVGDEITTLAEVFKARGYRTGGFVGAFVLDHRWGIAQGFDRYFDDFDLSRYEMAAGLDAAQRPGSEVVDRALAWLGERSRPAVLRLGAFVRSAQPLHAARAVPIAISRDDAGRVRRRGGGHRRADRPAPGVSARPAAASITPSSSSSGTTANRWANTASSSTGSSSTTRRCTSR